MRNEYSPLSKLLTSLLVFFAATQAATGCIECEHIGFADTEENAIAALNKDGTTSGDSYCISGGDSNLANFGISTTASYCVAQFFIYKAKDMTADSNTSDKA